MIPKSSIFIVVGVILLSLLASCDIRNIEDIIEIVEIKTTKRFKHEKVNDYLMYVQELQNDVISSMTRYRKGTEVGANNYYRSVHEPGELSTHTIDMLKKSIALHPEMEKIDSQMTEVVVLVQDLDGLIDEMKIYYDREAFKQDDYARAITWHPVLEASYTSVITAFDSIRETLFALQSELMQINADRYKEEGYPIRHKLIIAMIEAQAMNNLMRTIDLDSVHFFDSRSMRVKLANFTETCDDLVALSNEKETVKHDLSSDRHYFEYWVAQSSVLIKELNAFVDRVDANDFSDPIDPESDGSPTRINQEHNALVDSYSRIEM